MLSASNALVFGVSRNVSISLASLSVDYVVLDASRCLKIALIFFYSNIGRY